MATSERVLRAPVRAAGGTPAGQPARCRRYGTEAGQMAGSACSNGNGGAPGV